MGGAGTQLYIAGTVSRQYCIPVLLFSNGLEVSYIALAQTGHISLILRYPIFQKADYINPLPLLHRYQHSNMSIDFRVSIVSFCHSTTKKH